MTASDRAILSAKWHALGGLTLLSGKSADFDGELLERFGVRGPLKMGWLRVLDIPFDILASLLYRSTRHSRPGCTNMAPRAPRVCRGPKPHGTTTTHTTRSAGAAISMSDPSGPYGTSCSPGAVAATSGSSRSSAQELLGRAGQQRVEDECCLAMWDFSATRCASEPGSRS